MKLNCLPIIVLNTLAAFACAAPSDSSDSKAEELATKVLVESQKGADGTLLNIYKTKAPSGKPTFGAELVRGGVVHGYAEVGTTTLSDGWGDNISYGAKPELPKLHSATMTNPASAGGGIVFYDGSNSRELEVIVKNDFVQPRTITFRESSLSANTTIAQGDVSIALALPAASPPGPLHAFARLDEALRDLIVPDGQWRTPRSDVAFRVSPFPIWNGIGLWMKPDLSVIGHASWGNPSPYRGGYKFAANDCKLSSSISLLASSNTFISAAEFNARFNAASNTCNKP
jgi:hypothetical protein